MLVHGHLWRQVRSHNPDTWEAVLHERFYVTTWPFGSFHQAKVIVAYPHSSDEHIGCGPSVGLGLAMGKTREEAMQRGLEWVASYIEKGPSTPEEVIQEGLKNWPTLFKTREDVIEQLFFIVGGGYRWLDGALIETDQEPPPDFSHREAEFERLRADIERLKAMLPKEELARLFPPKEPEPEAPPTPFKISKDYSNICHVPPDVRPDWKKLTLEAAELLCERGDAEAREVGLQMYPQCSKGVSPHEHIEWNDNCNRFVCRACGKSWAGMGG